MDPGPRLARLRGLAQRLARLDSEWSWRLRCLASRLRVVRGHQHVLEMRLAQQRARYERDELEEDEWLEVRDAIRVSVARSLRESLLRELAFEAWRRFAP